MLAMEVNPKLGFVPFFVRFLLVGETESAPGSYFDEDDATLLDSDGMEMIGGDSKVEESRDDSVLISGILRCVFVFVPFVAFQAYGYYNLCDGRSPDKLRPWCKAKIPLLYNFIQSHYWGVGFLRYFQLKQLPNFLLASPILSIALCSIIHYVNLWPKVFFSLGFQVDPKISGDAGMLLYPGVDTKNTLLSKRETSTVSQDQARRRRKSSTKEEGPTVFSTDNVSTDKLGKFSIIIIPFVLHLGFMVATAIFIMHVQVATRFLSASPLSTGLPPTCWYLPELGRAGDT